MAIDSKLAGNLGEHSCNLVAKRIAADVFTPMSFQSNLNAKEYVFQIIPAKNFLEAQISKQLCEIPGGLFVAFDVTLRERCVCCVVFLRDKLRVGVTKQFERTTNDWKRVVCGKQRVRKFLHEICTLREPNR